MVGTSLVPKRPIPVPFYGMDHLKSNFSLIRMVGSSLAPKLPIMLLFDRMDHQKSYFSLISDILSVRGCWGQPMLLFLKLVDKTQMLWPPEHAIRDMRSKISICVSVRANLLYTFQCETPCKDIVKKLQLCSLDDNYDHGRFMVSWNTKKKSIIFHTEY